jgi:hypothetical protein
MALKYERGSFLYRLAGRNRQKRASYYTPQVLTSCQIKYTLKEALVGRSAAEKLELNELVSQLPTGTGRKAKPMRLWHENAPSLQGRAIVGVRAHRDSADLPGSQRNRLCFVSRR